jgi:hypothetical protein
MVETAKNISNSPSNVALATWPRLNVTDAGAYIQLRMEANPVRTAHHPLKKLPNRVLKKLSWVVSIVYLSRQGHRVSR